MKRTNRLAISAVIAAAAGYIAGILTAPKSGKDTRKDIQDTAVKVKTEAEKKLKALHSELNDLLDQAKSGARKVQKGAGDEFASIVTKAQIAKEKAREILSALHDDDANDEDLKKAIDQVKQSIKHLKAYVAKNKPSTDTK